MGQEVSKLYVSYSFHLMWAKLHVDIGYHGGIQAVTFKKNVTLLNFNMGVHGKTQNVEYLKNGWW